MLGLWKIVYLVVEYTDAMPDFLEVDWGYLLISSYVLVFFRCRVVMVVIFRRFELLVPKL